MRIVGLVFAVLAVTVWWEPLALIAQSVILALVAVMCFAFSSLQRRTRRAQEQDAVPPQE